jgi:small GTP-binding protein
MRRISKKICLLGDFGVGKTSLVRRFVYDLFDERYLSTVGVKVSRKSLVIPVPGEPVEITMLLWDLAGNEAFDAYRAAYMRGSAGTILVCDLSRPQTIDTLADHVNQMRSVSPESHFVIAGNKRDLLEGQSLTSRTIQVEEIAMQTQTPFFLTSAKESTHVEEMFRHLSRSLLQTNAG